MFTINNAFIILITFGVLLYIFQVLDENCITKRLLQIEPQVYGHWIPECKCMKHLNVTKKNIRPNFGGGDSYCGEEASFLGVGQKIISYSLFVKSPEHVKMFTRGLEPNLKKVKEIFSGWYIRVYTDVKINSRNNSFCNLSCNNDELSWCNIHDIPKYGNLSKMDLRMWRFLPMGDPTVDIWLSRDLDSEVYQRERDAVLDWEKSNATFHTMRDIKGSHDQSIMGGMFGTKNHLLGRTVADTLREEFIRIGNQKQGYDRDQYALRSLIYGTFLRNQLLSHDSYMCKKYKESRPFPTKRQGHVHVGDYIRKKNENFTRIPVKCPKECRPSYGQDWEFC